MTAFLVFRELPGVTRDQYGAAQQAVADIIASGSIRIRYPGGSSSPAPDPRFRRRSAAEVIVVNKQAGVPLTDVLEAIDLCPAEPHPRGPATQLRRNSSC